MLRPLLSVLSPAGARGRLSILIFHRVLPGPDPLFPEEVHADRFDTLCAWVRRWFTVLPLDTAVARLHEGTLPPRALSITFDDGYADNHDIALPILQRHGLKATFYVATGFLDGGRMWNDTVIESVRRSTLPQLDLRDLADGLQCYQLASVPQRRAAIDHLIGQVKYRPVRERAELVAAIASRAEAALPNDLMMRTEQVQALRRAGMQIGAHTMTHPILARLSDDEMRHEIAGSKQALESMLDEPVTLFAYPNGKPGEDYDARGVDIVRTLGFHSAVSTAWGAARRGDDLFQIPRFTPWDRSRLRFGARMARNLWSS